MPCLRLLFLALLASSVACSAGKLTPIEKPVRHDSVAAPAEHRGPYALLVGCTHYPHLSKESQLEGPANDVALMRRVLTERFGFHDNNIVTLADAEDADHKPTRAHIKREFDRLARIAKKGDQFVILLAGHGSQQPDQEPFDEVDGLDEIFLPADAEPRDEDRVANAIVDDELGQWCRAIVANGASLWVIVDACHSGTLLRGEGNEVVREVPAEKLIARAALDKARRDAVERHKAAGAKPAAPHWAEELAGIVAIYAAQPTETTVERPPYDGSSDKKYGLFTYTLCTVLTQARSPLTYRELTERIYGEYIRWGRQAGPVPLVEGADQEREVLGTRTWPGRSRFLLAQDKSGRWTINAGQLHGLTDNSILAVFPPAGQATDKPLGHVRIQSSRIAEAAVVPCVHAGMKASNKLPSGGRCEPVYLDYGSLKLPVAVRGQDEAVAWRKHLALLAQEPASLIALAADPAEAEWLLLPENDKAFLAAAADLLPPSAQAAPHRFLVDSPATLKDRLTRLARARNLLRLASSSATEDVARSGALLTDAIKVDLKVIKLRDDKDETGTPLVWKRRGMVLKEKEWVAFQVHNGSRFVVDVTLLFINAGYGIEAVLPRPGIVIDNRIAPDKQIRIGPIPVTGETVGLEHLAMIAVRAKGQPVDFTCLTQPTVEKAKSAPRGGTRGGLESPLGKLLTSALYGQGAARGLSRVEIDKHVLRLVSWYVDPANSTRSDKRQGAGERSESPGFSAP